MQFGIGEADRFDVFRIIVVAGVRTSMTIILMLTTARLTVNFAVAGVSAMVTTATASTATTTVPTSIMLITTSATIPILVFDYLCIATLEIDANRKEI